MNSVKQKRPSEQRFPIVLESVPVQTLRGSPATITSRFAASIIALDPKILKRYFPACGRFFDWHYVPVTGDLNSRSLIKVVAINHRLGKAPRREPQYELAQFDQGGFNQPSYRPKLREESRNKENTGIAVDLHRMNDGDTEHISEHGKVQQNNEKRRPF
jgi:hypothetical protein